MKKSVSFHRKLDRKKFMEVKRALFLVNNKIAFLITFVLFVAGLLTIYYAYRSGATLNYFTGALLSFVAPFSLFYSYKRNVVDASKKQEFQAVTPITLNQSYATAATGEEEGRTIMVSQLHKAMETKQFFFLFTQKRSALFFTKDDMTQEDIEATRFILEKHLQNKFKRWNLV